MINSRTGLTGGVIIAGECACDFPTCTGTEHTHSYRKEWLTFSLAQERKEAEPGARSRLWGFEPHHLLSTQLGGPHSTAWPGFAPV